MERLSSRLFNQIQFLYKDAKVALFSPNIIFPVMTAGRNCCHDCVVDVLLNKPKSAALLFNMHNLFAY